MGRSARYRQSRRARFAESVLRVAGVAAAGLQAACSEGPAAPTRADTLTFVLQVVEQTTNGLSQAAYTPLTEATVMQSLRVSGARMAIVADSFPDLWGRTFVYDPTRHEYVPDDGRPGPAPG